MYNVNWIMAIYAIILKKLSQANQLPIPISTDGGFCPTIRTALI